MSCLTAANENGDGEAVARFYAKSSGNYDATLDYILNSHFRLRNETVSANGENRNLVFVTNYDNLRCYLMNSFSNDGSIIQVETHQQNSHTIIAKIR
ncbi:hypothetical protein SAMN05444000_107113 [Shimia gijangensis]|uniref:Uncharacterized protein n=1 Tax=Shimia gijangensis TaxID=1470563 RepID=A0A1M6IGN4_9RHOB|nr:hypothetical protein SAMN05444000_107113 [Shimia gijangensis]